MAQFDELVFSAVNCKKTQCSQGFSTNSIVIRLDILIDL